MNIDMNRSARKWTRKELAGRILWAACKPLFRWSPRLLWGWRCFLLRLFGARIGRHVQIHPTVRIFIPWNLQIGDWSAVGFDVLFYNLGMVTIGPQTTISQRAHLCAGTHDYTLPDLPLLKPPIIIGDQAWICADAFIGPGITMGQGAIVAARATVTKDVAPWSIVAGNPAQEIKQRIFSASSESMS